MIIKLLSGKGLTLKGMERIDEFVVDRIINDSQPIKKLLIKNGFDKECALIKTLDDFYQCRDDFTDSITDIICNFFTDESERTHIPDNDEWFEGGDESVFDNGEYCWEYHEFEGWFYYISPEGDYNGLNRLGESVLPL